MSVRALSIAAFIVLGLAYAALPGVVNTEAIRRGMLGGFNPLCSCRWER